MARKALPDRLLERIRMLGGRGEIVPVFRLIAALATDEAAVRRLAQEFPSLRENEIRGFLSESASVLRELAQIAADVPAISAESRRGAPPGADGAEPAPKKKRPAAKQAPPPPLDDPSALQRVEKIKVFIDGASQGNPGPATIGVVFTTLDGQTIHEISRAIGTATNNVAEYTALITALRTLLEWGRKEAYCFSDSELLVNQLNGSYKIRNPGLMPLAREVQSLRRQLSRFQVAFVPRSQNQRADFLAARALKPPKADPPAPPDSGGAEQT